ncbi:type IV pilus biogenesis/stability protein PilW [Alteromonas sp. ASW11-36]|uniref:Type IV pilus biogenesis/stability protein PilW n=1 Tax=Alteromonas arenosi TaxID=3055817 RepID=A0ABT7SU39_9ALTE|nr:type IV pilus biogenesis/stability protein PilW [Alteromonas sp. ASW11-36]MDM7859696.1 type IV pilus biogenesis/stability protein PilW [Alteromonas sp. ASW11-36]
MFLRSAIIVSMILLSGCVSEPLPEGFERSNDFDQVEAAKTRISLGLTYLKNGNYTQAKINLDKALEFAPRLADAHYSMAYYYQLVDEVVRAEESYKNALKLDSRNPDIANSYGAFLCQQSRYEEAKEFFMRAVNSQSYANSAETYENMALCSLSQNRSLDAINYLNTALNHQPTRAKSLFLLAELQAQAGQYNEAKQTLARYQRVARVSADTLWLSVQIERGLGEYEMAEGYGEMLMRMYPGHRLTKRYITSIEEQAEQTVRVTRKPAPIEDTPLPAQDAEEVVEPEPVVTPPETTQVEPEPEPEVETRVTPNDDVTETPEVVIPVTPEVSSATGTPVMDGDRVIKHQVAKRENLYRISLRYNVKIQSLIEWNNLPESGAIDYGMLLWVVDPATIESEQEQ